MRVKSLALLAGLALTAATPAHAGPPPVIGEQAVGLTCAYQRTDDPSSVDVTGGPIVVPGAQSVNILCHIYDSSWNLLAVVNQTTFGSVGVLAQRSVNTAGSQWYVCTLVTGGWIGGGPGYTADWGCVGS